MLACEVENAAFACPAGTAVVNQAGDTRRRPRPTGLPSSRLRAPLAFSDQPLARMAPRLQKISHQAQGFPKPTVCHKYVSLRANRFDPTNR